MDLKKQIKQKVITLSRQAEDLIHDFRTRLEGSPRGHKSKRASKPSENGHIRSYQSTSREERKLH